MKRIMMLFTCLFVLQTALAQEVLPKQKFLELSDLPKELQRISPEALEKLSLKKLKIKHPHTNLTTQDKNKYVRTGYALDFALLDDGYVVARTPGPLVNYVMTRLGRMSLGADGALLISSDGLRVQNIYLSSSDDRDLYISTDNLPPKATSSAKLRVNIASNSVLNTAFGAYNARGNWELVSILLESSSAGVGHFNATVFTNDTMTALASGSIVFDGKGQLARQSGLNKVIIPSTDGLSDPIELNIDFSGSTSYDSLGNQMISSDIDGYSAGNIMTVGMENDGTIDAYYSNGVAVHLGIIHVTSEVMADLTPYMPMYPKKFWTPRDHPEYARTMMYGVRFLPGYLEKDALTPVDE